MTKNLNQLAQEIYKEALADDEPVTMEEAIEMAKMEIGAKQIKNYVQSSVEKKNKKPRERKVDDDKKFLLGILYNSLLNENINNLTTKTETEINFNFNNSDYTIKLVKHRPKK